MSPESTYDAIVLGDRAGYLALAFGRGPYRDERGTYRHREWTETRYQWPAERDLMRADVTREQATGEAVDIYVCPAVRYTDDRRKGSALPPMVCWADLDGPTSNTELLDELQPYTVASGQPGHTHVYLPLTEQVPIAVHAELNKALAAALGGDAKWSDESLLRLPGSNNHKTDPPSGVTEPEQWSGRLWAPAELAEILGVDLSQPMTRGHLSSVRLAPLTAEPPPETLPARVQAALNNSDILDRSKAHARLVGACYDSGLTQGQTLSLAATYKPSREKYGDRLTDEVGRWWGKVDAKNEHRQPAPVLPINGATALAPIPLTSTTTLSQSDDGNALALVDRFGDRIRYCAERGRWLHWTGQRWQWCGTGDGVVREYAKQIARGMPENSVTDTRWKQRSLSAAGTSATLTQAASDPRIVVSIDQLDAHPRELNTPGGIVDLVTGDLRPHDPGRLHTQITAVAPDFTADPGRWLAFLVDTFGDDTDLVGYVQRLIGYSASGEVRDHILPFCFGGGGNGKGVLLETGLGVLGDYATTAPNKFLMAQTYTGHETEIARLNGKRLIVCSEVNDGDRFDEAKVKILTGGDTLTARFMNQDHFTFRPSHKLWLLGNSQPDVASGGGDSFWRRLRLLPFLRTVAEEKRVDDLQGIFIREHGPAVLAWIIQGAVDYYKAGLRTPETVRAATADYAATEDNLARFIAEECHLAPDNPHAVKVKTKVLRERYMQWCRREFEEPVSVKRFGMDLKSRFGVTVSKSRNPPMYEGITVHADPDEQGWQPE